MPVLIAVINNMNNTAGIVILAAGSSSRLGEPKQLLPYKEQSLLRHACRSALGSCCSPVVTVLGSEAETIIHDAEDEDLHIVINREWEEGIASSIRCGLEKLLDIMPDLASVILMLCDQPFLEPDILNKLVDMKNTSGKGIAACTYRDTLGTPVLFDRQYYPELMKLSGQEGAKILLYRYQNDLTTVSFPMGGVDIDTQADYLALINNKI